MCRKKKVTVEVNTSSNFCLQKRDSKNPGFKETKLYRTKISGKVYKKKDSLEEVVSLKQFLLKVRTDLKEFPPSQSRSKINENLQGLIDCFAKKEKSFQKKNQTQVHENTEDDLFIDIEDLIDLENF